MRDDNGRQGGTDEPKGLDGALDMDLLVNKLVELNRKKRMENKPGMRNRKAVQSVVDKILGGQDD